MQAELFDIDRLPDRLVKVWNQLLLESPEHSAFLSHAFCHAVQTVRGGVRVLVIREQDKLSILPFQFRKGRRLLGHAEEVGDRQANQFGMIGNSGDILSASELLTAAKLSSLRFSYAVPSLCPFMPSAAKRLTGVRINIETYGGFVAFLMANNKQFVHQIFRSERHIEKEVGKLRFEAIASNPRETLERLIRYKQEQYRRTHVSDDFLAKHRQDLMYRILVYQPRSPLCQPYLSNLYSGDRWVASSYFLRCSANLEGWYTVFDPSFRKYGPGHLLLFKLFEWASSEGVKSFDLGQGATSYKAKYRGQAYERWEGVIRLGTVSGLLEQGLESLSWRIQEAKHVFASAAKFDAAN